VNHVRTFGWSSVVSFPGRARSCLRISFLVCSRSRPCWLSEPWRARLDGVSAGGEQGHPEAPCGKGLHFTTAQFCRLATRANRIGHRTLLSRTVRRGRASRDRGCRHRRPGRGNLPCCLQNTSTTGGTPGDSGDWRGMTEAAVTDHSATRCVRNRAAPAG